MTDVSVIIPTFNRAEQVVHAIESCFAAAELSVEAIVVDDGSTDNTRQSIIDGFSGWHLQEQQDEIVLIDDSCVIRYVYQTNSGAPAARNHGLRNASGTYVKFLDSDDLLIEGALTQEFEFAQANNSDVVVTGWIVLEQDENGNQMSQTIPAPDLSRGLDDMLLGRAPWTSAAFYRRTKISHLSWDESIEKAQEWMWAWIVCFDGLKFDTLDIPSAYYVQHEVQDRITQAGNVLYKSTVWRLKILNNVEQMMRESNCLTQDRANRLIQYYYKDARVLCEMDVDKWQQLHRRMVNLNPDYKVSENQTLPNLLIKIFGLKWGMIVLVKCKLFVKSIIKPSGNS